MLDAVLLDFLVAQIKADNSELFDAFEPHSIIQELDSIPDRAPYHFVGNDSLEKWAKIRARFTESGFEAFQKVTMLLLMRDFESRALNRAYTEEIVTRFNVSYSRILDSIQNPKFAGYRESNDILLKDLALCRQKLFPAGAQVVEPLSGFERAILYRGGLGQALGVFRLLLQSGGSRPWYQIHTHLSEREEFNPGGWDLCYMRIAGMLERHPEVKGMWGGSWFYDPALARVSPRLSYLRELPQSNGAMVFYSNVDPHGGALSTSETRRRLYEKGEYMPKAFVLLWPRKPMIEWAHRFQEAQRHRVSTPSEG